MYSVFYCDEFNQDDLVRDGRSLKRKCDELVQDLKENKYTNLGDMKLIKVDDNVKYFRAKLSDTDRLLLTSIKHNGEDAFVFLEIILNHEYKKSKFLKNKEKIKHIKIIDQNKKEVSGDIEVGDVPKMHWLGKFITLNANQEDIVGNDENLPLVVSGHAGSGKTSVALEKLRKIEDKFKEGKILYVTQSEILIKESRKLYEYEYHDEAADEWKVGIPERIEFLSIDNFMREVSRKDEEIKRRIDGKKQINRNAFSSWFDKECKKGAFKKYRKYSDRIFEEFTAVIAGGGLVGEEGKNKYMCDLGKRQSIFPTEERKKIYSLFDEYKKFIEGNWEYYDASLIAHECVKRIENNKIYDAVVVDEVQDLTQSVLKLILKSLKDESKNNFLLCGDVNQVIHPSFFSTSKVKDFLCKDTEVEKLGFYILEDNYRNSQKVVELANRVLHLKNYCSALEDKIKPDEKEKFFMKGDTDKIGNVCYADNWCDKEKIQNNVKSSVNWAVLVLNYQGREEAEEIFGKRHVFSVQEAKGLGFENVVLYKFDEAYEKIWNTVCPSKKEDDINKVIEEIRDSYKKGDVNTSRSKNKEDKSCEENRFYMNVLYVAATRAIDSVYIYGDEGKKEHPLLKGVKLEEDEVINIGKDESNPEEWKDEAIKLINNGNIGQAKDIAIKLVEEKEAVKKRYVKEIINELKVQGYNEEAKEIESKLQSPDKDKLEQVGESFSGLKLDGKNLSSCPSQKPLDSNSESRISAGKANACQKHKNKRDKKHKAKLDQDGVYSPEAKAKLDQDGVYSPEAKAKLDQEIKAHMVNVIRCDDLSAFVRLPATYLYTDQDLLDIVIMEGGIKIARHLIGRITDINDFGNSGSNPLNFAIVKEKKDMVKLLLEFGADVNIYLNGLPPLRIATQRNLKDIVALLLEHEKTDVNARDCYGLTALHVAVRKGSKDIIELLLNHEKIDINVRECDDIGDTPLNSLIVSGVSEDIVLLFLRHERIHINTPNKNGVSALHCAISHERVSIIKLLLEHEEIDVNTTDNSGVTPLTALLITLANKSFDLFKILFANANINIYQGHFAERKFDNLQELFNKKDKVNRGLFMIVEKALRKEAIGEEVKQFLEDNKHEFYPSFNYSNREGRTVVDLAACGKNEEILQLLLNYAAKKRIYVETVKPLLVKNDEGKFLLDKDTSVKYIDVRRDTFLHLAARTGDCEFAKFLLGAGASVNARDDKGRVPLLLALQGGHSRIVDLLLSNSSINIGCVKDKDAKNEEDIKKILQKSSQDNEFFNKVKKAATTKDKGKLDGLLEEIRELMKPESKYGFRPSLNCSDLKIALGKSNKKLLELLYGYANEIGANTEILNQLKCAIEQKDSSQPEGGFSDVYVFNCLTQSKALN